MTYQKDYIKPAMIETEIKLTKNTSDDSSIEQNIIVFYKHK